MSKCVSRTSQIKVNNGKPGKAISNSDPQQQFRQAPKPKLTEEQLKRGSKLNDNALDNMTII